MNFIRGKLVSMQKPTFAEIRHRYKEKNKKRLRASDAMLEKKLEEYRVYRGGQDCFDEGQDAQEECEKIVDFLMLQYKALHEKKVQEKYDFLVQTLPKDYQKRFPDTIRRHAGYTRYLINKRKNLKRNISNHFKALKTMLSLMDKEITEYSDEELAGLIRDNSFTTAARQYAVWFLTYIYNQKPEQFKFSLEMSMLRRETVRGEADFYTHEEWAAFADVFFDIDRHIKRAYEDCFYARSWLYALLHMSLAWRKSDVLHIPALENLIDVSEYTLDWFENNVFSLADAQQIINHVKLAVEQYHTQKTGAKKHFNIPQAALLPTAIAFIICEQWRRKKGQAMLFEKFYADTKRMTEMFGLETDFLSMKANRTLLSMFNETAGGMAGLSGKAGTLTSYMRSHKISKMGNANITKVYLRSTYNEKESVGMGKQSIDRGFFGWLYDRLLDLADNKRRSFIENTGLIVQMKEVLPAREVESVSGALYGIVREREMLLNEIYSWQEDEIKEKTELLFSGKLMSRTDDVSCLMNGRCPYPTEDKCMLCRYSIPTTFSLTMAGDELKRLLTEFGRTDAEDVTDRINLTYQIGKLVMVLKEAIDRFGYEYIETYIDYEEINELIKKETPNMIFLEEIQNDRK